jgi:cytochrome c oxidase subunit IV
MGRQAAVVLYVLALVGVVFFRHLLWERLAVNVGIVLVFLALYFRFLRRP